MSLANMTVGTDIKVERRKALGSDVILTLGPTDFDNPDIFAQTLHNVPIYDVHVRQRYTKEGVIDEEVDENQLAVICQNTQKRIEQKEYPLVFLGHTDDDGKEIDQPPVAGFITEVRLGRYNKRGMMYADIAIRKKYDDSASEFPRRSVEIIRKLSPDGYIDSLALLKRMPERPMGVVCRNKATEDVERYEIGVPTNEGSLMGPEDIRQAIKEVMPELIKGVVMAMTELFQNLAEQPVDELADDVLEDEGMPPEEVPGEGEESSLEDEGVPPEEEGGNDEMMEGLPPEEEASDEDGEDYGSEPDDEDEDEPQQYRKTPLMPTKSTKGTSKPKVSTRKPQVADAHNREILERLTRVERFQSQDARRVALTNLREVERCDLDVEKLVERCSAMSDEDFNNKLAEIRENYRKLPDTEEFIDTADLGHHSIKRQDASPERIQKDDIPEMYEFAQKNKITDAQEAIMAFREYKKSKTKSA